MKVSVSVTTYNHGKYIAQAIESVLCQQVDFDYEIIIGEDCSTDDTRNIVIDYQRRYPDKIRLVLPEKNLGCYGNKVFIRTLEVARGEYIAMTDGDDYWLSPHKLRKQVDFLNEHPQCSMCFHDVKLLYEDEGRERLQGNSSNRKKFSTLDDLWPGCFIDACSVMFRRGVIDALPAWFESIVFTDWAIYLLLAERGLIGYLDEVMAVYRKHSGGIWSGISRTKQLESVIGFYEEMNSHFNHNYEDTIKELLVKCYFKLAMEYEKSGDLGKASNYLSRCFALRPDWLPDWLEDYWMARGVKRDEVWNSLQRRLWLYRHPSLYKMLEAIRPVVTQANRLRKKTMKIASARSGKSIGTISASPNPIAGAIDLPVGATSLSWTAEGAETVEIRIGGPDGQIFSRADPAGSATTGDWVIDGMVFYLQDVTGDLPLTSDNTLDTVTVRIAAPLQPKVSASVNSPALLDKPLRLVQRIFNAYSAFKETPGEKLDASRYDTDKEPEFLRNYESFFRPLRDKEVKLLELGVNKGGSLLLWRDYFERGMIAGLDVYAVALDDPTGRIRVYQGLQQDCALLDRIGLEVAPEGFDLIIDDASHIGEYSRASFWHLFLNHLKPGGIYVIEDWGTGYWDAWPDGKKCETVAEPLNGAAAAAASQGEIEKRQYQSHLYGMVGFIKELVDECGLDDLTNEERGGVSPARSSRIRGLSISFGQVFVVKK